MLTNYGVDYFTNLAIGNGTTKSTWYLALLTGDPYPTLTGTTLADIEVVDATAYERKPLAKTDFTTSSGGAGSLTYNLGLSWDTAVVDWGIVTGYALCDSSTAGQVYIYGSFPNTLNVITDQYLYIEAGILTLTLAGV